MIITTDQITHMDETGIRFVDDEGKEQFIDFEACYRKYLNRVISSEGIESFKRANPNQDVDQYTKMMKEFKEVGQRNVIGHGASDGSLGYAYIRFHTDPQITLTFKNEEAYWRFVSEFREFGWQTFDMT